MTQPATSLRPVRHAVVDIAIPVYNEAGTLDASVRRLHEFLDRSFPFAATITIVDNASTDATWLIASRLAKEVSGVRALHLDEKGRGRALRTAWMHADADVVAYMDVDLSTDLDALLPLVAPLLSGHSDVAIGSRLARGSRVIRGPKREVISRAYNVLLKVMLRNRFSDAQCGFKALRAEDARILLPEVEDEEWFFDTELLVLAERNGLRIHEVPVDWADDPDSRVRIGKTAAADLAGVWRLMRERLVGGGEVDELAARSRGHEASELARFASVGLVSTIVYLVLVFALSNVISIYLANVLSLGICSIGNLAAHYRITYARRGRATRRALVAGAWGSLLSSAVLTTVCLLIARAAVAPSFAVDLVGLLLGSALAAFVRFMTLRAMVFHAHLRATETHPLQQTVLDDAKEEDR